MPLSGYLTTLPSDLLLSPAIIRVGSANLGVTKGPPRWEPGWSLEHFDFDGRHAIIKGLSRKFYGEARLSFTLLDVGEAATGNQIAKLEAGSTAATAGAPSVTTITPKAAGALYAAGDYLTDVRAIWERSIGTGTKLYFTILLSAAIVLPYTVADVAKDVATTEWMIAGVKDMATGTISDAPYKYEYREALP